MCQSGKTALFCECCTKSWRCWNQNRFGRFDEKRRLLYNCLCAYIASHDRDCVNWKLNIEWTKKSRTVWETFGGEEQYPEYRSCFDYSAFFRGFQVQDVCLFCCFITAFLCLDAFFSSHKPHTRLIKLYRLNGSLTQKKTIKDVAGVLKQLSEW